MVKVLIKKLNPKVNVPSYKTKGASGMDLMACLETQINLHWIISLTRNARTQHACRELTTLPNKCKTENARGIRMQWQGGRVTVWMWSKRDSREQR